MGIIYFIGFLFVIVMLASIKTNMKLRKEKRERKDRENNSHHNIMIF